jgi:hypothetical protein
MPDDSGLRGVIHQQLQVWASGSTCMTIGCRLWREKVRQSLVADPGNVPD